MIRRTYDEDPRVIKLAFALFKLPSVEHVTTMYDKCLVNFYDSEGVFHPLIRVTPDDFPRGLTAIRFDLFVLDLLGVMPAEKITVEMRKASWRELFGDKVPYTGPGA